MKKIMIFATIVNLVFYQHVATPITDVSQRSYETVNYLSQYDEWYDEDGKLKYPISDEEWKTLGNVEAKFSACQIPQEILDSISTEELLYMVEIYPFMNVIYLYESSVGFEVMKENFNGLQELLSRSDCKEVVLQAYDKIEIPQNTMYDYEKNISDDKKVEDMNAIIQDEYAMMLVEQDARNEYIVDIMELILSSDEVQDELTDGDIEYLTKELNEKANMKAQSEYYDGNDIVSYYSGEVEQSIARDSVSVTLTTRNGTRIPYSSVSNPSQVTISHALSLIADVEGATIVEYGDHGYNCFAYAWLSLDGANNIYRKRIIVEDDSCFLNDINYKRTKARALVGNVVSCAAHAAVVAEVEYRYLTSIGEYKTDIRVIGKWGQGGPVVSYPLSVCPYIGCDGYFYK